MIGGVDLTEKQRRELADANFGGEVLSAHEVPARDTMQMLSVRVEPELIAELRRLSAERGCKLSDFVREALAESVHAGRTEGAWVKTWVAPSVAQFVPAISFGYPSGTSVPDVRVETHFEHLST